MITSERQLKAANEKIESLKQSLRSKENANVKKLFAKAGRIQTQNLVNDLEKEIEDYEALKKKGVGAIKIDSFEDLFLLPIRYRIAKNMTQEEFANLVGIPLRQICRYESEEYSNISSETLKKILQGIPLKFFSRISESA